MPIRHNTPVHNNHAMIEITPLWRDHPRYNLSTSPIRGNQDDKKHYYWFIFYLYSTSTSHYSPIILLHIISVFCHLKVPISSAIFPVFSNKDSARGCRALTWYQVRNILARLCFAPDDSQPLGALVLTTAW